MRSSRRGLAAEQALEPRPGGADADVARAGEAINFGDFFLMSAIARRQQDDGFGGTAFDAQNFGIKKSAPGFVISGGQRERALRQHEPRTVVENEFTLLVARKFAVAARGRFFSFAAEEHVVFLCVRMITFFAARKKLPKIIYAEVREAERPAGDEPGNEQDDERPGCAQPRI